MAARPTDVIVVGAGIVGAAIACELARRGASVELIDQRQPGMGATQASGGMLAPYKEASEDSPLLELGVRSLGLYDDFVARAAAEGGTAVPYRRSGTLDVATQEATMARLKAAATLLAGRDVAAEIVDAHAARGEEPQLGDDVIGALLIPAHGFVAAAELTRALAAAARRHGTQVVEGGRVTRIAPAGDSGDLIVTTERGTLTGNAVVIAAGSWSGQIDVHGRKTRLPVSPVRGQLLRLGWNGVPLRRITWSERCYIVPWDDGTVLVGATMEDAGFDERATAAGVRDLLEAACDLVPHAWSSAFLGARVGLRPGTPDELPIIGASRALPNLFYATGHFRNGILLAPITAKLVADAMIDGKTDPAMNAVSPQRFGEL
jgi:glycine oxidase